MEVLLRSETRALAVGAVFLFGVTAAESKTVYDVRLLGFLTTELNYESCDPIDCSTFSLIEDPNLEIGDKITITARFGESRVRGTPAQGSAYLYGLPLSGPQFFKIQAGNQKWSSFNDYLDGEVGPSLGFKDGKVTGFAGQLLGSFSETPLLESGSRLSDVPSWTWAMFRITPPNGLYGNVYPTQGFLGEWDLAGSRVRTHEVPSPVPLPAAAPLFAGALVGAGLLSWRKRRALQRSAT
jgi:hypothetical protein